MDVRKQTLFIGVYAKMEYSRKEIFEKGHQQGLTLHRDLAVCPK